MVHRGCFLPHILDAVQHNHLHPVVAEDHPDEGLLCLPVDLLELPSLQGLGHVLSLPHYSTPSAARHIVRPPQVLRAYIVGVVDIQAQKHEVVYIVEPQARIVHPVPVADADLQGRPVVPNIYASVSHQIGHHFRLSRLHQRLVLRIAL